MRATLVIVLSLCFFSGRADADSAPDCLSVWILKGPKPMVFVAQPGCVRVIGCDPRGERSADLPEHMRAAEFTSGSPVYRPGNETPYAHAECRVDDSNRHDVVLVSNNDGSYFGPVSSAPFPVASWKASALSKRERAALLSVATLKNGDVLFVFVDKTSRRWALVAVPERSVYASEDSSAPDLVRTTLVLFTDRGVKVRSSVVGEKKADVVSDITGDGVPEVWVSHNIDGENAAALCDLNDDAEEPDCWSGAREARIKARAEP